MLRAQPGADGEPAMELRDTRLGGSCNGRSSQRGLWMREREDEWCPCECWGEHNQEGDGYARREHGDAVQPLHGDGSGQELLPAVACDVDVSAIITARPEWAGDAGHAGTGGGAFFAVQVLMP